MTSNVLLFRIPYVLINASRFLVANQMGTLRRVTVDYTSSLATFGFTYPGHDMLPLHAFANGSYLATIET